MRHLFSVCYESITAEWKEVVLETGGQVFKTWLYPLLSAYNTTTNKCV